MKLNYLNTSIIKLLKNTSIMKLNYLNTSIIKLLKNTSIMKLVNCIFCLCFLGLVSGYAQSDKIPYLKKQGTATQLIVDGKPFFVLGGELANSSASSISYMEPIWKQLADQNLNTVLATVSWDLIEPQEGKFDLDIVDKLGVVHKLIIQFINLIML
jgi:hypothetical protein